MSADLITKARQIREDVRLSEDGMEAALANNVQLVGSLIDARRSTNLSSDEVLGLINGTLEAISYGAAARERLLTVHAQLGRLDLREIAGGDLLDCPPAEQRPMGKAAPHLRLAG